MLKQLSLTTVLIATVAGTSLAQDGGRMLDTAARARAGADSAAGGHNWFTSLLRKIARRSDDNAPADSADVVAPDAPSEVVATLAPMNAHSFKSKKDSASWESARGLAERSSGFRVVVDLFDKQLYVIDGSDTLRSASVATAKNETLEFGGRKWTFVTPRGVRTVGKKEKDPKWTPPEWHFAEVALEHGLKLQQLERGRVVKLKNGNKLVTQGDEVGIIDAETKKFEPMVLDEHIVFDNTLYIPPTGTKHRVIEGELGHYRLDLGDAYYLHGTPYAKSIGTAVTHGCVRLHDDDIEWLFDNVPVGTKVYIY